MFATTPTNATLQVLLLWFVLETRFNMVLTTDVKALQHSSPCVYHSRLLWVPLCGHSYLTITDSSFMYKLRLMILNFGNPIVLQTIEW